MKKHNYLTFKMILQKLNQTKKHLKKSKLKTVVFFLLTTYYTLIINILDKKPYFKRKLYFNICKIYL